MNVFDKANQKDLRKRRIRAKVTGTAERPRLTVTISLQHISAQIINDQTHQTLAQASTIGKSNKTTGSMTEKAAKVGEEIAKAAKAAKINIPYSCEAGRCGSCVATCIKGKIWMAYNEVLTDDEVANGRVLVCQSYPVGGDVVIEF